MRPPEREHAAMATIARMPIKKKAVLLLLPACVRLVGQREQTTYAPSDELAPEKEYDVVRRD